MLFHVIFLILYPVCVIYTNILYTAAIYLKSRCFCFVHNPTIILFIGQMSPVLACWAISEISIFCCWSYGWIQHATIHTARIQGINLLIIYLSFDERLDLFTFYCISFFNWLLRILLFFRSPTPETVNHGRFGNSSSQIGQSKPFRNLVKVL